MLSVLKLRLCSSVFKLLWSRHFFPFFFWPPSALSLSLSLLLSLSSCLHSLAFSPRCATRDQRWLTGVSTSNMDCVSKPLPALQLCHFLLRISPETTKWLGRPWHENAGTERFSFFAACASLLLSAHRSEVIRSVPAWKFEAGGFNISEQQHLGWSCWMALLTA